MEREFDITAEPIEALRLFRIDLKTSRLMSLNATYGYYEPGEVIRSQCKVSRHHQDLKPEFGCTCGIWAVKSRRYVHQVLHPSWVIPDLNKNPLTPMLGIPARMSELDTFLTGRVLLWGRVIEHEIGYRAEFAQIIGQTLQWYPRKRVEPRKKLLAHLREVYSYDTDR